MAQEYEPLRFSIKKILPHGLFILAGSPKVGKSWLSLDLCKSVATGGSLWDFAAEQGDVLYLALEDSYNRLQNRLKQMEAETMDISRLHLAVASFGLQDGLIEQVHNFMNQYPNTNLIVIDTLEHIRNGEQDKNMYACDYRDMNRLREITSKYRLTLILVHHTRKMYDPNPLNTISGSTGLVGAVDGVFVLEKAKRAGNDAKLTIANRDTGGFCFDLRFDTEECRWSFIGNNVDISDEDNFCVQLDDFLLDDWRGTATELCNELARRNAHFDFAPSTLIKRLKAKVGLLKKEYDIIIDFDRTHSSKRIFLRRQKS